MAEVRIDIDPDELAIMDGYIAATGKDRKQIITELVKKWTKDKLHESIVVCRMARINPLAVDTERQINGSS